MEEKRTLKIIGVSFNFSENNINAGLCEVSADMSCKLLYGTSDQIPPHINAMLQRALRNEININELCQLNFLIGECFAKVANLIISEFGKPDFIASNGITICNYPYDEKFDNMSKKSLLQIGESSVIAKRTGCLVISDFGKEDIAFGGQGGPLESFAYEKWFKNTIIQSIDNKSSATVISNEFPTFSFDIGCGDFMINYCCQKLFQVQSDKYGEIAAEGVVSDTWLDCLLQDEYYYLEPPKTVSRTYFNERYVENILRYAPNNDADIIATLTALTAKTIAQSYERFIFPQTQISQVVIGGIGALNKTLMKFLKKYLPNHIELKTFDEFGLSNIYKDSIIAALLGYCTYYGIPNNLPECTGASKRVVMGKFTY